MSTITYDNITVSGVSFTHILELSIDHKVNEHGTAFVKGEMEADTASDSVNRLDENTLISIKTSAAGQPSTLFCGLITGRRLVNENGYMALELSLISTSYKLDIKKNRKSFQNKGMTYSDIITKVLNGRAQLEMNVTDKPTGTIEMQYDETDWEFIKRMAQKLGNASVFTSINTTNPIITIGMPIFASTIKTSSVNSTSGASSRNPGTAISLFSDNYCFVGDHTTGGQTPGRVHRMHAELKNGILNVTSNSADQLAFFQTETSKPPVAGRMMLGTVKGVKKDTVQVHLVEVDAKYDEGGDYWFPYSTAYSSGDGSGFYCMPEIDDSVRVFFPSDNVSDAFVASATNTSPLSNPKDKMWRGPGGKDILMTEEGLYINGKDNKIFINLTKDEGIMIYSEKAINIYSSSNINITAHDDMVIQADNEIHIGCDESFVNLTKEQILVSAEKVMIN